MSYRIRVLLLALTAVLVPAILVWVFSPSFPLRKQPPRLTPDGTPVAAVKAINQTFAAHPEIRAAALFYVQAKVDEVLFADRIQRFDLDKAERSNAGLFCLVSRARRLGHEISPSDMAVLDIALQTTYPDEFENLQKLSENQRVPVLTHEHQACDKAGLFS